MKCTISMREIKECFTTSFILVLLAHFFAQITTQILLPPYLPNRCELDAHIFTQGRYETLDVPFGGLVDFRLGDLFLGQKTTFLVKNLVRAVSLEPLGS